MKMERRVIVSRQNNKQQIEAEDAGRRRTEIMMDNYEANLKADVTITGDGSDIHHFTR